MTTATLIKVLEKWANDAKECKDETSDRDQYGKGFYEGKVQAYSAVMAQLQLLEAFRQE